MGDSSRITRIRFAPAQESLRSSGMLGWTSLVYGDFLLDHIAVRVTQTGRQALAFPKVQGKHGRERTPVRPTGAAARETIERVVLAALRARGDIPYPSTGT